jgi:hypothetical protein
MKNNRNSILKSLKDKFPKFSFIGIIGKGSLACVFLWYAYGTYKKMQFKNKVADLEVNYIII